MINGSGGGGKSGGSGSGGTVRATARKADPYEQSLRSLSTAEVVEILCEGPILGLVAEVDEGEAYIGKSIAFDDTPLMSAAGTDNFSGYNVKLRKGTASQNPIQANRSLQTTITYDPYIELTETGSSQEIDLPEADSLKILLYAPAFYSQNKKTGSFYNSSVWFSILVNDNEWTHDCIDGQTTGPYQRQYEIPLAEYGAAPWTVKIILDPGEYTSDQTYVHDRLYWTSTIGVTGEKFSWPYVAHSRIRVGAKKFSGSIPSRAYEIYGYAECPMPDVYDPDSTNEDRFSGTWDGETWQYEWTDNPAWCWLAMLTNERFGLGVSIDDLGILKWQLCKIAKYCDGFLTGTTERRWTFNAVIQTQEEAYHMLNSMASAFLAYPIWASNEVLIMQDAPDDPDNPADVNPTHIANQANVAGGSFNYSGSAINARHTVARITWNDPDDFGRPAIAYYENIQGIKRYGWRPKDVVAMGCNSYSQAVRYGRWVIDTELNAGDVVTFVGDMSFGDCAPGCRFAVMDPHFADARFGGRLVSATSDESFTYLTLDDEVTLAVDTTYTIHFVMPMDSDSIPDERQDQSTQIVSETVLNSPQTTNTLTIALQSSLPEANAYWYLSEPNLNPRYFTCIANEPQEGMQYKITGLYHDYSKYGRIYDDVIIPVAPESYVPSGIVAAPTNFTATEYSYESGNNWRPGVALAWSHIDDARVMYYQVDRKRLDADEEKTHWHNIGDTEDCSFNIEPCRAGDWSFRVRGMGVLNGEWGEIASFTVVGKTVDPPDVTGLQVKGGGTTFTDKDLHVEWDTVVDEDYMPASRFWRYQVNIYDIDDVLKWTELRTKERMTFSRSENLKAFGTLTREFKVGVSALDIYRNASETETVITVSNPAPDMSAFTPTIKELTTGLRIDWSGWDDSAISDLKQFRIYCDTSNPPTTLVAKLAAHRDRYKYDDGIKSYASHYVQIVPYDEFGEGIGSIVAASTGQDVDIDKPIEIASSGKLIAGDVTGARVEYSSEALAGYSDETTKEFEISSTDGKIKAGGGSVTIGFDGVTLTQGVTKVNRIGWTSGASKVAGTDGYEYTCILSHIASSDNKPGEEGNNWPTYWQKEDRLGVGYWQPLDYYHAAETDNISMLYGVDDPSNYLAYTTLHTRGDNIGASAETRVRARCASGKTAKILLYVNDDCISFSKTGSNPAALEIPAGIVVKSYSDIIAEANADAYITGGMSIGSVTNQNPAIGDVWVQSGIYLGSDYSAPGNGQVIAEGQIKTATKFVSTIETGNKPIDVASTTVCTNLNADMVDGKHAGGANGLAVLNADAKIAYATIQNVSATDKILGRVSSGAGTIEEITCTAAGRALLDDATSAAQCTTLGLGTTDSPAFAGVTVSPSSRPVTISSGQVSMKGSAGGWTIGTRFLDSASEAVGSFSAFGWDDDLVRYYLGTFESAELLSVTAAGKVGIGVTSPTYNLEIAQGAARHIGVQRQTASNTGGNNLNIYGGSATVAAENKNGGSLRLRPGLCTGSGYGEVQIYGCLGPGSGSSTTDGTYQELLTCRGNKIGFFAGTPAVQQVLAAYTADSESSAYTTTGSGADIASKADLNALRTAYETLRAMCEDLRTKVLATTLLTS